jgi:hypothetical protein
MKLETNTLCGNDDSQEIKVDFFKSETSGAHKILGTSYFTLQELKDGKKDISFKSNNVEIVGFNIK